MDTKTILIGGAGLAALYILSQPSGDAAGFGGGGGALPLLPQLDDSGEGGDTFNLEEIFKTPDFSSWGNEETKKGEEIIKPSVSVSDGIMTPSYLDFYKSGGVSPLASSVSSKQRIENVMSLKHFSDPLAVQFSGRKETIAAPKKSVESKGAPWWNPFAWDRADAIENYLAYSDKTWGRNVETRNRVNVSKNISVKRETSKQIASKKTRSRSSGSSSGFYHDKTDSGDVVTVIGGRVRPGAQ